MSRRREMGTKAVNLSTALILPMFGIDKKYLEKMTSFVNSYITDDRKAVIVFDDTDKDPIFKDYLDYMKNKPDYCEIIEEDDKKCVFFKVPQHYEKDFDMFVEGHYSKFSQDYKNVLKKFYGQKPIRHNHTVSVFDAIYPLEEKKRQIVERLYDKNDTKEGLSIINEVGEVLDKPNLNREMYKSIKQLTEQLQVTTNSTTTNNEQLL